ncbi:MAG: bifunctional UDP-N-acetylmuramoyl-tripeptide:D-alanyl-D-alanine ligase/alanine racemase, partial [Bacteroidetes bacterium]|nr:bifunctional UDP-N-acetylmuramoyl-tripeptide:D-alanyl-D-alanine ligase/alanine racemase [Bacteroidota bacterium]
DSRKLIFPSTTLFFALNGARRNGNKFIDELYKKGVRNFVLNDIVDVSLYPEANIISVENSLDALQQLAAHHRSLFDIPVIGITGSNGKTIVKEWLNQLLEDKFNIVRSPRSYNSQIGVPLSIWQMNETHELAIFEAGISEPGEMKRLEEVIKPTIGVFTNIGEAHAENFKNIGQKAREKAILFTNASIIIYPADSKIIGEALSGLHQPVKLFGWGQHTKAQVSIRQIEKNAHRTVIHLSNNNFNFSVTIPFADNASIENAINCICVLLYLGTPTDTIIRKMFLLSPIAMRLELKSGINNCSVINDSYSADLSSLKIALDFLEQQKQHAKKTVILSDILQSDKPSEALYKEVAQSLQQKKINRLIGIGDKMIGNKKIFEDKIADISFYHSTDAFKQDFHQLVFRDETILIKGARVFGFEKIDQLLAEQIHRTVLEIDLNAMTHNLKQYQQLLKPSTKLMAMVKAFAYGSGSFEIANLLQFHKVDYLAVAYTDEAIDLRKGGISLPIMVMNVETDSFEALIQYNLEPVIFSFQQFALFDAYLKKEGLQQFPVHIEFETGMNRLGFELKKISELESVLKNSNFKIQSAFSHLAASEEFQQDDFTKQQAMLFGKAADELQQSLGYTFIKHISNSAAIIRHPDLQFDMVRLGIGLYGIDSASSGNLDLIEISTLKSTIAQIKQLSDGVTVGYNRKGVAEGNTSIATVRIGYADGYPRSLGNGNGKMLLKGHLAPVIGSVCMDMTMIDITGIPDVKEGDEVIVFGKELSVQQVAKWAQTIPYEILTGVSQRVKRIYFEE